jgi:hypothetical protein
MVDKELDWHFGQTMGTPQGAGNQGNKQLRKDHVLQLGGSYNLNRIAARFSTAIVQRTDD